MRIKFVGKQFRYAGNKKIQTLIPDDKIPRWRRSGLLKFHLPDGATQKKGFEHPQGAEILKRWPDKFKKIVRKGDK